MLKYLPFILLYFFTPVLMAQDTLNRTDAGGLKQGYWRKIDSAGMTIYTGRFIDGKPADKNSPLIMIGGDETYEARCVKCYELTDKNADKNSAKSAMSYGGNKNCGKIRDAFDESDKY